MRRLFFLGLLAIAARGEVPGTAEELLRRTGRAVEEFWKQFSAVNCVETVEQSKFGDKGKVAYKQDAAFDYLIVLQLSGAELTVDESRVPLKEAAASKNLPMLITNGFSTFQFIFHPLFQNGFEYSDPERVNLEGRELLHVRFRQVRGSRSPTVLRVRQREYPIEWQGEAWIDPASYAIVRIAASLASSMQDIGLKTLSAEVRYEPTKFKEDPAVHWLPATATIEAETMRQHWRNVHSFTKYRHFSVDVNTRIEDPK